MQTFAAEGPVTTNATDQFDLLKLSEYSARQIYNELKLKNNIGAVRTQI